MIIPILLATLFFTHPVDHLVLRDGSRVTVAGDIALNDDRVVFVAPGGSLYSLPLADVDMDATEAGAATPAPELTRPARTVTLSPTPGASRALKVSEEQKQRLLRELAANHAGKPAPEQSWTRPKPQAAGEAVDVSPKGDEWYWRDQVRSREEELRRRQENLDYLIQQERALQDQILGFLSLGYKPNQFSYEVGKLAATRDSIPLAKMEVDRAKRALDQFRDDARRQGILPGWLR